MKTNHQRDLVDPETPACRQVAHPCTQGESLPLVEASEQAAGVIAAARVQHHLKRVFSEIIFEPSGGFDTEEPPEGFDPDPEVATYRWAVMDRHTRQAYIQKSLYEKAMREYVVKSGIKADPGSIQVNFIHDEINVTFQVSPPVPKEVSDVRPESGGEGLPESGGES